MLTTGAGPGLRLGRASSPPSAARPAGCSATTPARAALPARPETDVRDRSASSTGSPLRGSTVQTGVITVGAIGSAKEMRTMEMRTLGSTGVQVSPLCLGAMMLGGWGNPDQPESTRIVHRALDAGVNFIDTADVYS